MDSPEDRELSRAPFRCHPPIQGRSASYTQDDSTDDRELSRAPFRCNPLNQGRNASYTQMGNASILDQIEAVAEVPQAAFKRTPRTPAPPAQNAVQQIARGHLRIA